MRGGYKWRSLGAAIRGNQLALSAMVYLAVNLGSPGVRVGLGDLTGLFQHS